MEIDKTTLNDLSVFNHEEEFSIFHKLDFTRTIGGREKLRYIFNKTLTSIEEVKGVQDTIKFILKNKKLCRC